MGSPLERAQVYEELKAFIQRELSLGELRELDGSTPLVESGVLESLNLVALIAFIESQFGIKVEESEIIPGNFENLDAVTSMVLLLSRVGST